MLKFRQRIKNLLSRAHILHKTLNLVISRCCLAEYSEEMYQNSNALAEPLLFSLNPIVCDVLVAVAVVVSYSQSTPCVTSIF